MTGIVLDLNGDAVIETENSIWRLNGVCDRGIYTREPKPNMGADELTRRMDRWVGSNDLLDSEIIEFRSGRWMDTAWGWCLNVVPVDRPYYASGVVTSPVLKVIGCNWPGAKL